jgi:hypothetical protein
MAIGLSLASMACGDDEEGGGASCAQVQMTCASDPNVEITCEDWDASPASVRECAADATTCDAVAACLGGG